MMMPHPSQMPQHPMHQGPPMQQIPPPAQNPQPQQQQQSSNRQSASLVIFFHTNFFVCYFSHIYLISLNFIYRNQIIH